MKNETQRDERERTTDRPTREAQAKRAREDKREYKQLAIQWQDDAPDVQLTLWEEEDNPK